MTTDEMLSEAYDAAVDLAQAGIADYNEAQGVVLRRSTYYADRFGVDAAEFRAYVLDMTPTFIVAGFVRRIRVKK